MKNFFFVFQILQKDELFKFYLLILLFLISTICEIFGIGLFLPLLKIITDPTFLDSKYFEYFYFLKNNSQTNIIIVFSILILILFTLKIIFTTLSTIFFNNFIANKQKKISFFLVNNYLKENYIFFSNRNSSSLIQNSINETSQITYNYLNSLITLISEFFFLIGVIIFLLLLNPYETLVVLIFLSIISTFFYNLFKRKYLEFGVIRNENDTKRFQTLEETFGSIKDIILKNKQSFFLERFKRYNNKSVASTKKVLIYQSLPRIFFEFIFILFFVSLIIYLTINGSIIDILPTLGVLAVICLRTIPSINKIFNSLNNIKYATRSIDIILNEIKSYENKKPKVIENDSSEIIFKNNIELKKIFFKFSNSEDFIFENLNFLIKKNTSIGVMADSGVGKSTLINILSGLIKSTKGEILVDGRNVDTSLNKWMKKFSVVPQNFFMLDDTIEKNITFGEIDKISNEILLNIAIQKSELNDFINSRKNGLQEIIGQRGSRISGGQQQRLSIARALYSDPEILVFDEATNSLDKKTEESILNTIKKMSSTKTIIQISHDLDALKYCDEIYKLSKEKLEKI